MIFNNEPYKVSILVPIYGVEKYIRRCAISLFEQTYSNLEFVFVNDCTKDKSMEVLNATLKLYPRRAKQVKIINHEKNRGLAASRNTAVDNAMGLFLMHVDSDDWLEVNAVKEAVLKQIENNADFVSFNSKVIWPTYCEYYKTPDIKESCELVKKMLRREVGWNVWGRLIRKSLYTDNNIRAIEGCDMGEDAQVVPRLVYHSKRTASIDLVLYNYNRSNENSYTSMFSPVKYEQLWKSTKCLCSCFSDVEFEQHLKVLVVKSVAANLKNISKAKGQEADCYFKEVIRKRVLNTNKETWKCLPLPERLMLYISNKSLLSVYVKVAGIFKRYVL